MRFVQTFWSGWANPREKAYGWPCAEYNLMSWALSCCCLRRHYEDVELYTDELGYNVLIDEMHLPYTKVHVVYDKKLSLPQHWAYAKIKTYSMQQSPFIHIDGDIYIPRPLSKEILSAKLVAQNREIGTVYYREMMNRVLDKSGIRVPRYILDGIRKDSIASYNMGVFGGTDLNFIKEYCQSSFDFFEENQLNDITRDSACVDCNLLFEQVFFAAKADMENRKVTVLCRPMCDEGYTSRDFCNLTDFSSAAFFHILGGHKQSPSVCYALEKILQKEFPSVYLNVCNLFKRNHSLLYGMADASQKDFPLPKKIIDCAEEEWKSLSIDQLMQLEWKTSAFFRFLNIDKLNRNTCVVCANPYMKLHVYNSPIIRKKACEDEECREFENKMIGGVCLVPSVSSFGKPVVPVSPLGCRVIQQVLEREQSYGELKFSLRWCFSEKLRKQRKSMYNLFFREIIYLFYYGILLIKEV